MKITDIPIALIKVYRMISRYTPSVCRFTPSCSAYALEAFERYGFFRGLFLSVRRLLRCHPWHAGGFDPLK